MMRAAVASQRCLLLGALTALHLCLCRLSYEPATKGKAASKPPDEPQLSGKISRMWQPAMGEPALCAERL